LRIFGRMSDWQGEKLSGGPGTRENCGSAKASYRRKENDAARR
jgi:hypothetical protein